MQIIDMSPVGLFLAAGWVGRSVMTTLLLASVATWVVIVETWWERRRLDRAIAVAGRGEDAGLMASLEREGRREAERRIAAESVGERRTRVAEAMTREAQCLQSDAERGLPWLAMIASAAPFVGLFGTVWGIMSSFIGIASSQDTSLAVVAPGIAEALSATAIGLAAAIPASLGYNRLAVGFGRSALSLAHHVERRATDLALEVFRENRS